VTLTSSHQPGDRFPQGTTTVTYTATDDAGNTATCSFDVIVNDNAAPLINGCPADISASANASCQAVVNWAPPTVDDCSTVTLTGSHQPGDSFPVGSTEITYTATDNSGNSSSCKFDVIVQDDTPPLFQSCPPEVSTVVDNTCQAIAYWTVPTAIDNCQVASLSSSHSPGDTFQAGITEVEYKATDTYGNVSFCRFNVIVKNEELPVISGCPGDILARAGESGEVSVTWQAPTATAQCGSVSLTSSHIPGALFAVGTTPVEYKAIDDSGNTTLCTFNVIVSFEELTFDIVKVVTPDGDGINDEWIVSNIEKFSSNNVVIVDRWGSVIYRASGYNNNTVVWKGVNSSGALVPTGTYFYVIKVDFSDKQVERSGFIELIR
jgi:gliding motility-associated-like protein